jgi:hypothetical protein
MTVTLNSTGRRAPFVSIRAIGAAVVLIAGTALVGAAQPAEESKSDAVFVSALEAGLEQWLADVEILCTYRIHALKVPTFEMAQTAEFASGELEMSGTFAKLGRTLRFSNRYAKGPEDVSDRKDGTRWSRLPFDEVSNDELQIVFPEPHARQPKSILTVSTRYENQRGQLVSGPANDSQLNPLSIAGPKRIHHPFRLLATEGEAAPLEIRVAPGDEEGDIVVTIARDAPSCREERRVVVAAATSQPVIREVLDTYTMKKAGEVVRASCKVLEFTECGKTRAPRKFRYIKGSTSDPQWQVLDWISDDMGLRPPTRADFVIKTPPEVAVVGLKQRMPFGTARDIDIFALSTDDLRTGRTSSEGTRTARAPVLPAAPEIAQHSGRSWKFILGNLIVLILAVGLFLYNRRAVSPP